MSFSTQKRKSVLFYYIIESDISLDYGPGTNEWEFVSKLLTLYPENVICFAPRPSKEGGRLCKGVRYVAGHRKAHPFFYLIFQVDLFVALVKSVRRYRPSAIVVRPGLFPFVPLIIARWFGTPLFVKCLGMGALQTLPQRYFPIGKYLLYPMTFWAYRKLVSMALLIDTVSATYVNWASETFGIIKKRLFVIPNQVNVQLFHPTPNNQMRARLKLSNLSRIVGFVGSLSSYCGVDNLILVSKCILKRYPDTTFLIVGDGRERQKLEALVEERGVHEHFLFIGHVSYDKVPDYINVFDVSVILWPSVRMLKVGSSAVKLGQYLACGCPVVASRGDGHEFIEQNSLGWLVVPEDQMQVSDAICASLSLDSKKRKCIGKIAREYAVTHFSAESVVRKRYNLWITALRKSGR